MSLTDVDTSTVATQSVLLIDDDPAIIRLIRVSLEGHPYRLLDASTAAEGVELAARKRPDLIILDLGLPDAEGFRVIETVREWAKTPIIVLSGRGEEELKVRALESGADDYVTKPFGVSELLARIKVALRHSIAAQTGSESPVFESGDLYVDMAARKVKVRGEEIHLTPIEYRLLGVLIRHAGKVVTHRQLLSEVWGSEYSDESQYLRVYMGYLRRKIEVLPERPTMLLTEPRVGYRLAL